MKIAIYSDPLLGKGGGSKVVLELANKLNADIITSGFDKKLYSKLNKNIKVIDIGNFTIKYNYALGYLFEAPLRFILNNIKGYDCYLYVGSFCIFASKVDKNNIWFCLTPNRIMYDLKEWKFKNSNFAQKIIFSLHILLFKYLDQYKVKHNFKEIITQTNTVKDRIKKYYNKSSKVIYSPVDTSKYKFKKIGDYYLAVSRLSPEKRMDLIAKTFTGLNEKLVLIGNGTEINKIKKIIKGFKNISLLNNISDDQLIEYYSNCKAVIYMPVEEDFGLVPIEAMASGKICIAADEGGCKETIIDGKTGYLIKASEKELKSAIYKINDKLLLAKKDMCISHAKNYDVNLIVSQWKKLLLDYS